MISSHSASTFAQITHRGVDFISNSYPTEIGICYTPIPITSIRPETSAIPGDNIPRCSLCSAFFNKFNKVERCDHNLTKFQCSLCGGYTNTKISLDIQSNNNAECLLKNEVYEALVYRSYFKRRAFTPTDFYVISLDLLRTNPSLLDVICNSYVTCFQPKQVGIAFIHGAITVVKFRPSTALQTFSDGVPIVKESQLFASAAYFRDSLLKIKASLFSLKPIENADYAKNFVEFGTAVSTKFGSSLFFILNESDFHNVAHLDSLKFEALNMCTKYAQASVCLFSDDEIKYRNPLLDLVSFTGGFLKVYTKKRARRNSYHNPISQATPLATNINFPSNDRNIHDDASIENEFISYDEDGFENELMLLLRPSLYHDAFLFVRPPDGGDVIDYAGYGFLKTNTGVCLSKVQAGDTFYFTINASKVTHPFIQFVIYYTTPNNERRIRVSTLPMMSLPIISTELLRSYSAAMVAQRIIAEDLNSASDYLTSLKKKFSNFDNDQQQQRKTQQIDEQNQSSFLNTIFTPFSSLFSYLTMNGNEQIETNTDFIPNNGPNVFDKANELVSFMGTERSQYLSLYINCMECRSGSFLRKRRRRISSSQLPLQQQQQQQQQLYQKGDLVKPEDTIL
ncbi:hypothetical protein M9Y10_014335 [Tritrichomonas musculus]|uniref:Zinc finger Sec23/Sec24-type domain-containing protein n=1 Tax=Tritrichomonas musculus TaxID=1915356 RepID=A0ABR2L2G9_9EUKA